MELTFERWWAEPTWPQIYRNEYWSAQNAEFEE